MYPSRDMNPIAIAHMQREREEADLAFLERAEAPGSGLSGLLQLLWRAVTGTDWQPGNGETEEPEGVPRTDRLAEIKRSALNPLLPR